MRHAWRSDDVRVRFDLKPDRLAGARILRPVPASAGAVAAERIASSTVVFEPQAATQSPPPVLSLEEQTLRLRARLVAVGEQAEAENPVVLTLVKFKATFTRACAAALYRASWIERERIKAWLAKNGHGLAAGALDAMPLPAPYVPPPNKGI